MAVLQRALPGSHIQSDKPICVTIKDDLVQNGNCADLHGDQLVPTDIIGTDYIAMRGNLSSPERVYILATQAGTDIFLDGAATPSANLNAGEQFEASLNAGDSTLFIHASALYMCCIWPDLHAKWVQRCFHRLNAPDLPPYFQPLNH
jgi:hypothetical protein